LQYDAGMFLESFSVELVVLAIWKRALEICEHWVASTGGSKLHESSSANESALVYGGTNLTPPAIGKLDFIEPSSACKWAEKGFILAFDHAEKLSNSLRDMDGMAYINVLYLGMYFPPPCYCICNFLICQICCSCC
jgi:serine/threonine-protein kinase ULK/ATG1